METELAEFSGTDRFEIRRRVGAGGMGVVYEAYDREHEMRVALKTLLLGASAGLYQFKQEFRNLAGVVHPNLATLYELFAVDDTWFFTMEFVEGCNFIDYVRHGMAPRSSAEAVKVVAPEEQTLQMPKRGTPVEAVSGSPLTDRQQEQRLRSALLQLAQAISALHTSDKLHCDIKPSNVLVTPDGRAVLLDFGLSTALQERDRDSGHITGTVSYMSPEQASGKSLTAASDWYAVGAMLYETLTGRVTFAGDTADVLVMKQRNDPPGPSTIVTGVPADLDALCRDLLLRDPARRPKGPEIITRLGGSNSLSIPAIERIPLVGRDREMTALRDALEAARRGKATTAFVHGSSGEGKSFLLSRFLEQIQDDPQMAILNGRCYEAESVPYKALDSLIDSLSRYLRRRDDLAAEILPRDARLLTRVFPTLREVKAMKSAPERRTDAPSDQELRRRTGAALRELLGRLGDRVTLVLCIDDLQWGDLDSGLMLSELLRGPDPPLLLFIGLYRSEYVSNSPILKTVLAAAGEQGGSDRRQIPIGALSHDEARKLAAELLGTTSDDQTGLADKLASESGGVPYFVHELANYIRSGAQLDVSESLSLEQVLARRFDLLADAPRRVLQTIAVAGQPIRQRHVHAASGVEGEERAAVALLRGQHLVRGTGAGEEDFLETYHDRVRETVVARLSADEARHHHGRLADVLEESGEADAETLAGHFLGAGMNQKAAGYYADAAGRAGSAFAFDLAATLYRQSLALRSASDPQIHELRVHLGDALANAGRGPEAAREYTAAIAGASVDETAELRRRAAYQYCASGHVEEGRAAMKELLRQNGVRLPSSGNGTLYTLLRNRARLWLRGYKFREKNEAEVDPATLRRIDILWSASAGLSLIDIIGSAAIQTEGLLAALDAGEIYRAARSLAWEAAHTSNLGSKATKKTATLLALASELSGRSGNPHAIAMYDLASGLAEYTSGRWEKSVSLLATSENMFRERCTGVAWEINTAAAFRLWALIYSGEFAEMAKATESALKDAESRGDLYTYTNLASYMKPHALLAEDDPAGARESVLESRSRWSQRGFYLQNLTDVWSESLIDLYEGNGSSAWKRLEVSWPSIKKSLMLTIQLLYILLYHLRGRAALTAAAEHGGKNPQREALLREAERYAKGMEGQKIGWGDGKAMLLRAGVASVRGDRSMAIDLLGRSAEILEQSTMGSYAASARRYQGLLIGGTEGAMLVSEADSWLSLRGVRDPARMARMHVGGIAEE